MENLCKKIRSVDISKALAGLDDAEFRDTGGTNGWLANPPWLSEFVHDLNLRGIVLYSVLRKLPAWQGIPPHVDDGRVGEQRFHVPLVTHPDVKMRWLDSEHEEHLEVGYLYQVDFTKTHEIVHCAPIDRVHVQINLQGLY